MKKKKYILSVFVIAIVIFILVGGYIIYRMSFDYISYSIKTFGQDKYRLIINTKDKITNNPIGNVTIDVIYITDSEEKKIVSGKSNRDGTIVFYLLPGYYKCEGSGIFLGETDILDLRENEEIDLKIWIPIR